MICGTTLLVICKRDTGYQDEPSELDPDSISSIENEEIV